jgi:hypothetical protein
MRGSNSVALRTIAALAAIILAFAPAPAEAYIDPGAGSMLTQLILGGIAAGAVIFRSYLTRLLHLFRPGRTDDPAQDR